MDEPVTESAPVLQTYLCVRCGYEYSKVYDYEPFLCYRCMRFLAKRTWTIVHQITPPRSQTKVGEV